MAVGIRQADHVAPLYLQKLALTWATGGGRSVGIVRSRNQTTELLSINILFSIKAEILGTAKRVTAVL
jgi:hypothetical protein